MSNYKERKEGFIIPMSSDVGLKGALRTQNEFFIKLASKLLNIPENAIKGGKFIDNETINRSDTESHRKVDLLFTTDSYLINIEGNTYTEGILYRNNTYIYRIIIDDKLVLDNLNDKYYFQININTKSSECNKKLINRYEMREIETKEKLPFTPIIVHVQLDYLDKDGYTKDIDPWLIKALKLFKADSEEEYKKIIGNDKLLGGVFKFMSNYSKNGRVLGEYDAEKDAEFIRNYDLKHAEEKGKNQGINERNTTIAKNMLNEKLEISLISKVTGLTIDEIKKLTK